MATVIVKNPATEYMDYCIMYRKIKGKIAGCLTLVTFCKRMRDSKTVTITDASKEVYKLRKDIKPVKITFMMLKKSN